jgi:hypothetical protein
VLGGLSVFKFATVDFKDAVNVYQGPFAGALKSIFPDFTIGQLNRIFRPAMFSPPRWIDGVSIMAPLKLPHPRLPVGWPRFRRK